MKSLTCLQSIRVAVSALVVVVELLRTQADPPTVTPMATTVVTSKKAEAITTTSHAGFIGRLKWRRKQRDVSTAFTTVLPGATPLAAFVTTQKLGSFWQHGEILLAYQTDKGETRVDLFDRVGAASDSSLKAGFLGTAVQPLPGRRKFRMKPTHVRAIQLSADTRPKRGYMLDRRRCFGHVDLQGKTAEEVHRVIAAAVQRRLHGQGFSYLKGFHCIGFANELLKVLLEAFPQNGAAARPVTFCDGQCSYRARPFLGEYLQEHGFAEMHERLQSQNADVARA